MGACVAVIFKVLGLRVSGPRIKLQSFWWLGLKALGYSLATGRLPTNMCIAIWERSLTETQNVTPTLEVQAPNPDAES